jgi:Cu/Zn superoxide dismutase
MRTLSRTTQAVLAAGILASSLSVVAATTATANSADLTASLQPVALNGVDGSGTALVTVRGTRIDIAMAASGLLADAPHAAHIHFGEDARHECPGASDDLDASGTLNTSEGGPAYGPVAVSLTKTGDTSPASALAIDRFDTAPRGNLTYERGQIKVSQDVAKAVTRGEAVIVIHGVDHNHSGAYDGATASDLDPSLPTEATDPALCGVISQS